MTGGMVGTLMPVVGHSRDIHSSLTTPGACCVGGTSLMAEPDIKPLAPANDREAAMQRMNAQWLEEARKTVAWGVREGLLHFPRTLDSLTGRPPSE